MEILKYITKFQKKCKYFENILIAVKNILNTVVNTKNAIVNSINTV
jgi:hypothetical protein